MGWTRNLMEAVRSGENVFSESAPRWLRLGRSDVAHALSAFEGTQSIEGFGPVSQSVADFPSDEIVWKL